MNELFGFLLGGYGGTLYDILRLIFLNLVFTLPFGQ